MISALSKAFAQLSDPRINRVLKLGILGAIAAYVTLVAVVWFTLTRVTFFSDNAWLNTGADILVGLIVAVVPLLFFPALSTMVMGVWLEDVAEAVEARHYPGGSPARSQPWKEVLLGTLQFLLLGIAINLVAMPVYISLFFLGISFILAYAINGYLLGREYFEIVAFRHLERKEAQRFFQLHLKKFWIAGAIIAFFFSIPILNLITPVIGAAFMTHLFHKTK